MRKKVKYGLIALIILIPVSFIAGHEIAVRSEPFTVFKSGIMSSPEIESLIGEVQNISLGWFGYMIRYNGPSGTASFDVLVEGVKGNIRVFADLKRSAGKWQITKTRIVQAE